MRVPTAFIDGGALLEVLWSSALGGVGVTTLFGVAILGVTRAVDYGRAGRAAESLLMGVLGVLALAVVVGTIVFGMLLIVHK